jgi:hypothetical protein
MYEKPAAGKIGTSVKVCNLDSVQKDAESLLSTPLRVYLN